MNSTLVGPTIISPAFQISLVISKKKVIRHNEIL
jgi:hypothetical protein